jgi:hypothetical protein
VTFFFGSVSFLVRQKRNEQHTDMQKENISKKVHYPINVFEKFAYMIVEIRKNCSAQ